MTKCTPIGRPRPALTDQILGPGSKAFRWSVLKTPNGYADRMGSGEFAVAAGTVTYPGLAQLPLIG